MIIPVTLNIDLPLQYSGVPGPPGPEGPPGPAGLTGLPGESGASALIEQGAWSPVIGGQGGESGQSYHYQQGYWIKVGPLVQVWSYTQFSSTGTITGKLQLKNLPFVTRMIPGFFAGSCALWSNLTPEAMELTCLLLYAGGGQREAFILGGRSHANPRDMSGADLNHATQLILSLCYPTDG